MAVHNYDCYMRKSSNHVVSNVIPIINHNSSTYYAIIKGMIRCATSGLPYQHIKPNLNQSELNLLSSSSSPHNLIPLQLNDIKPSILYIDSNYVGELVTIYQFNHDMYTNILIDLFIQYLSLHLLFVVCCLYIRRR